MSTGPLPAGPLTTWLGMIDAALAGEGDSDVPCGPCTACCTSSQFVHVGPEESDALAHIPAELLFPAPGLPGHLLLGYDERGHCPLLVDGVCSIYSHRPRTCRVYDCRVFAATGVDPGPDDKPAVTEQAVRWVFEISTDDDRRSAAALRATVAALEGGEGPPGALGRAVTAVRRRGEHVAPDST